MAMPDEAGPVLDAEVGKLLGWMPDHYWLIDGWHRWTAHKKKGCESIRVDITETTSDMHLLELAIERNATHGLSLSEDDKRNCAIKIYLSTPVSERRGKRSHLAKILSIAGLFHATRHERVG